MNNPRQLGEKERESGMLSSFFRKYWLLLFILTGSLGIFLVSFELYNKLTEPITVSKEKEYDGLTEDQVKALDDHCKLIKEQVGLDNPEICDNMVQSHTSGFLYEKSERRRQEDGTIEVVVYYGNNQIHRFIAKEKEK